MDDSPLVRERLASLLAGLEGIDVVGQAADLTNGRRLLSDYRPDLLILDVDLAGAQGTSLLAGARQDNASLIIIMLTGEDHSKLCAECAAFGADFYFCKPTEFEKAIETCEKLAKRHAWDATPGSSPSGSRSSPLRL